MHDKPELADALVAARNLALAGWSESLAGERIDPRDARLKAYLVGKLQNPREERFHALFLDRDHRFIQDEQVCAGSADNLRIRTRHLIHRAMDLNAFGLIVAHNHTSGTATPSKLDREATAQLRAITSAIELELLDHFIIAKGSAFSMRLNRLV